MSCLRVDKLCVMKITDNIHGVAALRIYLISNILRSKFDVYWLDEINQVKPDNSGQDHNKLRTYKKLKGSFHCEPYIINVRKRNQRCELTRLRCSASLLGIDRLCYTRPVTPLDQGICNYCYPYYTIPDLKSPVDDEFHFLIFCKKFQDVRESFYDQYATFNKEFINLSDSEKLIKVLCPTSPQSVKLVNRYISKMMNSRKEIDEGKC